MLDYDNDYEVLVIVIIVSMVIITNLLIEVMLLIATDAKLLQPSNAEIPYNDYDK